MHNMQARDEVDLARAAEYSLLSALLLRSPDAQTLTRLANLRGDDTELGRAHTALGEAASRADAESVSQEFFELFIGLGRGELLPYASFYLTGFVQAAPLAQLRQDLRELGIERSEGLTEPRITRRFSWTSWEVSPRVPSLCLLKQSESSFRITWLHGSHASSAT